MYKDGNVVKQTLSSLQKRLAENNDIIQVQNENGHLYNAKCTFNHPASDTEIAMFEKQTGFILPTDYKEFLKITNGCRLFDDVRYGGEIEFYSLEKIIEYNHNRTEEYEGCYDIASIYQDNIVINSHFVLQNENNYLFWKSYLETFKEAIPLNMSFEIWFDRFVVCQGTKFWWWSII